MGLDAFFQRSAGPPPRVPARYFRGMSLLASIVAGRRSKWVVVVVWIVAVFALSQAGSKLSDITDNQTEDFLPGNAESTEVLRQLNDRFEGGQTSNGLIVYRRDGGLTAADKQKIAADAQAAADKLPLTAPPLVPFAAGSKGALISQSGDVAVTTVTVPDNEDKIADWGKDLRDITGTDANGMSIYVTGDLGFNADFEEVFSGIDTTLLLATVLLVLVLLGAIYRSPMIALIPLIVVGFAYTCAQGLIYLYAKTGQTVSDNTTSILVVLMFGVGTDYCLLLVSRYREELRRHEDKHEAMAIAVSRAGPAILASGLTVTLAMLSLLAADVGSTHTLGPVAAIGVFTCMVAGLTLLPALLTIGGRRGFWPRRRLIAYAPGEPVVSGQGIWRRIGDRVLKRPGVALTATVAFFAVGALGLAAYKVDYSTTTVFKKSTESVDGFNVIKSSFPAGVLDPTTVLIETDAGGPVTPAEVAAATKALQGVDGVAGVKPGLTSTDGEVQELNVVLAGDPFDASSLDVVPAMRSALASLEPEVTGLVGGGSAVNYDFDQANKTRSREGRPDRARRDRDHPRDPALVGRRAAGLHRERGDRVPRHARACRCCSSATWSATPESTARCPPSRSSSWSRSGSTTRSS